MTEQSERYTPIGPLSENEIELINSLDELLVGVKDLCSEIRSIVAKDGRSERLLHQAALAMEVQVAQVRPALFLLTGRAGPRARTAVLGVGDPALCDLLNHID